MTNEAAPSDRSMDKIYRSSVFGDWTYAIDRDGSCEGEWRQTKLLGNSHTIELRIKTLGVEPPDLTQLAWSWHIVEKQQFFLQAFVFWGRMALYNMSVMPEDLAPEGSLMCELKLSKVLVRSACLVPFYEGPESEYEIHAQHPVHTDLEFSSKWRGLETIGIDVRWQGQATMFDEGHVCLRQGTFKEKLNRALTTYDKLHAARDIVSRAGVQSRSS